MNFSLPEISLKNVKYKMKPLRFQLFNISQEVILGYVKNFNETKPINKPPEVWFVET